MNSNNIFSLKRFGLLYRYNLIHTYKRLLLSLFGGIGIFFLFLLFKSYQNNPFLSSGQDSLVVFFGIFGIGLFGTAFPAFRSKEKTQVFIMLPASASEKFLFDIISRSIILFLIIPITFWVTYLMEGYFYEAITNIPFTPIRPLGVLENLNEKIGNNYFFPSVILLGLSIPFMGATIFMRNPIGKTFFSLALILLFHLFMVYLFGKYFKLGSGGDPLWIKEGKDAAKFFNIYFIILTAGFLSVAYFKLKEKEV
jgi:hypothetical protein